MGKISRAKEYIKKSGKNIIVTNTTGDKDLFCDAAEFLESYHKWKLEQDIPSEKDINIMSSELFEQMNVHMMGDFIRGAKWIKQKITE